MITWQATIKERGNDHLLTPTYCVPEDGMHDYINEEYLIEFWGLKNPDVEWYKLEKLAMSTSMKNNWRTFPAERPTEMGEYLCRGIGGLNNKLHYYVCLWIGECDDRQIANRFFYGGNEFAEIPTGKFEFIKCSEL